MVAQAVRRGFLVKGGDLLDAMARTHTVLFDKTRMPTVGAHDEEAFSLGGSFEQASHHIRSRTVVQAASDHGLR